HRVAIGRLHPEAGGHRPPGINRRGREVAAFDGGPSAVRGASEVTSWLKGRLGRARVSTVVLAVLFLALFWVYYNVEPHREPEAPATAVGPPGFVPAPNYTWVPRTNVVRPTEVTTTTPTTTSPTDTTTTSPSDTTTSPGETTSATTTTGLVPSTT